MLGYIKRSMIARFAQWRARALNRKAERLAQRAHKAAIDAKCWLDLEKRARGPAPLRLFDWAKWGND